MKLEKAPWMPRTPEWLKPVTLSIMPGQIELSTDDKKPVDEKKTKSNPTD